MNVCACCGDNDNIVEIDKAHVKDANTLKKENILNHTYKNIITLCKTCHYKFFDSKNKVDCSYNNLGLKRIDEWWYFFKLESGKIEKIRSVINLDILTEYVEWKNKYLHPQIKLRMLKEK